MQKISFILIQVLIIYAQTYSKAQCTCEQLLSQSDCKNLEALNCSWDSTKNKCTTSSTVTPTYPTYPSYCDQFSQTDCPNITGCAWVSSKCTIFTGCTPFAGLTNSDCQSISSICITDGIHCIEKNTCKTYLKQKSCKINLSGTYCFWDATNNICVDANTCDQLPFFLSTDQECRNQISYCTVKLGGGCQESGINCSDQNTDISCIWNKSQTQSCFWNGTQCQDRICSIAPNILVTDDACKSFLSDGSCTTKSGGGCITRTTCQAATNHAACLTNSNGQLCYWNGTACVDKICTNAPATMTTNTACQGFISTCITTGTGCIDNGSCSQATIQAACDTNISGGACIWNTTCKDKICVNAPSTNNTHDLCTSYLSSCTVNSVANGCTTRTCDNAPISIVTNQNCEAYLPVAHCVTKSGGGCVTNGACSSLCEVACVKDINGNDCFWDTTCKDKTCTNAPLSANTHDLCQAHMKTCTVNSSGSCVNLTCENIQTQDICTTDFDGNPCIYKFSCQQISCEQANYLTTHEDCQKFYSQCTLSNSGTGCIPIPWSCQTITIQAACYLSQSPSGIALCGWNGTSCIDQDCSTLKKTLITTTACNSAFAGCVSANPFQGVVSGCMTLPQSCEARQTQDNCEIFRFDVKCLWNTLGNGSCQQQTCLTASITTTSGFISTFTNLDCNTYLSGCFQNNSNNGCMGQVSACSQLTSATNCNYNRAKAGGQCYWNSISNYCVDKTCINIPLTTHSECNSVLKTCTVNSAKTNCQFYAACNTYTFQDQCHFNAQGKLCFWTGTTCRDYACSDADSSYNTSNACATLKLQGSSLCNVIARVQALGCMTRLASCFDYLEQGPCVKDISGNICYWQGSTCYLYSLFTCANISLATYNIINCESVQSYCTTNAVSTACQTKVCSDYNTQNGQTGGIVVSTDAHCSALLSTCTIELTVGAVKCQPKQTYCSSFTTIGTCTQAIEGACIWTGSNCVLSTTCPAIRLDTYNITNCESINKFCTVNIEYQACQAKVCQDYVKTDGTSFGQTAVSKDSDCSNIDSNCTIDLTEGAVKCQTKLAYCIDYKTSGKCTMALEGPCYWFGFICDISTKCSVITLGTYNAVNCENVIRSCTINIGQTACQSKVCSDYSTQNGMADGVPVSTDAHCSTLLSTCTIDNTAGAIKCQTKQTYCNDYATQETCTIAIEGGCYWSPGYVADVGVIYWYVQGSCKFNTCTFNSLATWSLLDCEGLFYYCKNNAGSTACTNKGCYDYSKTDGTYEGTTQVQTDADCSTIDPNCTIDLTSNPLKCQERQIQCQSYGTQGTCTHATEGACYWVGNRCALIPETCDSIILSTYNIANCEIVISTCTSNSDDTACQIKVCSDYDKTNGLSTGETTVSSDRQCSTLLNICTIDNTAEAVKCQTKQAYCSFYFTQGTCTNATEGVCFWTDFVCVLPSITTCSSKSGVQLTDAICEGYHSSCTANSIGNACQARADMCISQKSTTCFRALEGDCISVGALCLKNSCEIAPITNTTDDACNSYLSTCTIARTGGCISRQACNLYTSQLQCTYNASGQLCYWSQANYACLDLTCANIDQTSSYNYHSLCNIALNTCTVRVSNGAIANGCQSLSSCSSYTIQDQCHINALQGVCEWNNNLATPACVDISCASASNSNKTHASCLNHNGVNSCTVGAVTDINGAPNKLGGCIPLGPCSSYIDQEQCHINAIGGPCGWNGTVCADYSCTTSPQSNNTDSLCKAYKAGCTVDQSGSGCMALLTNCESYQIKKNCIVSTQNRLCYWNKQIAKCFTRTCDNAPASITSAIDCSSYLAECTIASVAQCKTKICEDFQLTTDALCKASLSKCTTDGTKCVLRGTCYQALDQNGCVTDNNGNQCEWVPAANASAQPYCTLKNCLTAPTINTTESQCASYFTNCTTKNGGGCVTKSTCTLANVQAACTTASDGTKCQWDTTVTPNVCRNKDCQDYQGSTHAACQKINSSCTAGTNGFCARIKSCSNTTVRAACIQGTDGPCLWIAGVTNSDGTTGACYPYTSCKSLTWNSDNKCKLISPNCTTNGQHCLGISLCTETNINGGCVTGYDGNCIQTVSKLGSTDVPICQAFTSCSDVLYTTHAECQTANSKCTTNGTTGCIPLSTCSVYTQAGCYVNAAGLQKNNGIITSTGVCIWDSINSNCRDQYCSDLTGSNHTACVAQLATCTSDGTACLLQEACEQYTLAQCGVAIGTDGNCIWQVETEAITIPICRVMTCDDVTNGTTTTAACQAGLSKCVSTGTICINKTDCQYYTTQTSCYSGGIDGICYFTASTATGAIPGTGTCALMNSCPSASNDQYACNLAKSRCSWTAASGSETTAATSKCATHTCASYYETNNVCANFLNWGQTLQQVCQIKNGVCSEIDPTSLNATDCYSASSYTYTWNASKSKCGVCTTQTANNSNNSNTSNDITTDSGFILSFATVVFGYLVL